MAKQGSRIPRYKREAEIEGQAEAESGRILADPGEQAPNNSYSPPLFYEDYEFTCVDCGRREIWTAEHQKWWYEVAKGSIYAKAIRCRACREARRAATARPGDE